jgi:hypothetical protein
MEREINWERLRALTPPAVLRLADGTDVPHEIGQPIFNYYDHTAGVITRLADHAQPDTSGMLPDGAAWWVDTTAGYVDGSRMCSMATAKARGWVE